MMLIRRLLPSAALITAAMAMQGCGLQPLYGNGSNGALSATLGEVAVSPIDGEDGWLVQSALQDRLRQSARAPASPRYRIDIRLDDVISGFGVRADESVTRERRTLRARWQLVDAATGTTLIDATAGSDAGVDVVGSEFATIAAERTALERLAERVADQIVTRIALFARAQRVGNTQTP